jgi:O-antigen/teichoic acid export membrane protein
MVRTLSLVGAAVLMAAALLAPTVLPRFLGEQWLEAVPIFQVLCAATYVRTVGNPLGSLLLSCGRADLGFAYTLSWVPVAAGAAFLGGTLGGGIGVAVAVSVFLPLFWPVEYLFLVRKLLGPCCKEYVDSTFVPGMTAAISFVSVVTISGNSMRTSPWVSLAQASAALALYSVASIFFNRKWLSELWPAVRRGFSSNDATHEGDVALSEFQR